MEAVFSVRSVPRLYNEDQLLALNAVKIQHFYDDKIAYLQIYIFTELDMKNVFCSHIFPLFRKDNIKDKAILVTGRGGP
jgi:hypothetical protein